MKIVYSPMHGAGVRLVPASLAKFGFTNVIMVKEQAVIDGNFPTVESPNPEERKTMSMAIDLAAKEGADLVLATDPDSDRIGVALRNKKGEYVLLNGNQTLVLLLSYQLTRWAERGELDGNQYVVKTIVTSQMANAVADYFKVKCYDCLTGFKYIAKIIRENEGKAKYIGGGEESFGYLAGDYVRDKGCRVGLLAGGRGRGLGPRHDGADALRVAAAALCEVRLLPRRARVGSPQGQGGRRGDPEDDGRFPGQPAPHALRIARGKGERLPVARTDRPSDRQEDPPSSRIRATCCSGSPRMARSFRYVRRARSPRSSSTSA